MIEFVVVGKIKAIVNGAEVPATIQRDDDTDRLVFATGGLRLEVNLEELRFFLETVSSHDGYGVGFSIAQQLNQADE